MQFKSEQELQKFISDTPYYTSPDSFSLGSSFEDAAEVINEMLEELADK